MTTPAAADADLQRLGAELESGLPDLTDVQLTTSPLPIISASLGPIELLVTLLGTDIVVQADHFTTEVARDDNSGFDAVKCVLSWMGSEGYHARRGRFRSVVSQFGPAPANRKHILTSSTGWRTAFEGFDITGPVIVLDDGDVDVQQSALEARRPLEAPDVRDGVYEAFDAQGNRLELFAAGWSVYVRRPANPSSDPQYLLDRLRQFAKAIDRGRLGLATIETAQLPELIEALLRLNTRSPRG